MRSVVGHYQPRHSAVWLASGLTIRGNITNLLYLCGFTLVGFKRNLKNSVAKSVAVEGLNGDNSFIVVCHGYESKAFAFVGLQVTDDFHTLDGTEGTEQLPQDILLCLGSQVVDKDAPTWAVHGVARQHWVGQQIPCERRVPATNPKSQLTFMSNHSLSLNTDWKIMSWFDN